MTRPLLLLAALLTLPVACGGDDDDGDDNTSNTGGTTNPQTTSPQTSSTMEECNSTHECLNGACQCTTPGLEGMACTDADACPEECEICM